MRNSFLIGWPTQIVYFFGAYCIFTAAQILTGFGAQAKNVTPDNQFAVALLFIGTGIASFAIGRLMRSRDLAKGDAERTQLAELALEEAVRRAKSNENLSITLYLRPFQSTDAFRYRTDKRAGIGTPEFYERELEQDLERLLAEAMEDTAPLVALGQPGEHYGAGRLTSSDQDWKDKVISLANAAKYIVILPAHNEGTLWEVGWLKSSDNLARTMFVMPPLPDRNNFDLGSFWNKTVQEIMNRHQLALPEYRDGGALFRFNRFGRVDPLIYFPMGEDSKIFSNFLNMCRTEGLNAIGKTPSTFKKISVSSMKARHVSYYLIGAAVILVTSFISVVESKLVDRTPMFGQEFEQTFDELLAKNVPQEELHSTQTSPKSPSNTNREHDGETKQSSAETRPAPTSGYKVVSPVGSVKTARLEVPDSWTVTRKTRNSQLIRPPEKHIACLATSRKQEQHPAHVVAFASITEKMVLARGLQSAISISGINGTDAAPPFDLKEINVDISDESIDGPIWGYKARTRTLIKNTATVARVQVKMNSSWTVRLDCSGNEHDIKTLEPTLDQIYASLSLDPAEKNFTLSAGTIDDDQIDMFVEAVQMYEAENEDDRALVAARLGQEYIIATSSKNNQGVPSLKGVHAMKSAFMALLAGNIYYDRKNYTDAKKSLSHAMSVYDAYEIEDDLIFAARKRLKELNEKQ